MPRVIRYQVPSAMSEKGLVLLDANFVKSFSRESEILKFDQETPNFPAILRSPTLMYQCIVFQFLRIMIYLYEYFKQLAGSIIF